jgi:hypothetical protein
MVAATLIFINQLNNLHAHNVSNANSKKGLQFLNRKAQFNSLKN